MRATRILLGLVGIAAAVQGIRLLLATGGENIWAAATWLVGGVVLHDGVLGPGTILLAGAAALVLRRQLPKPVIVGVVVLATVTIVAIPVLGRYGARPDNPTLLDRNYTVGWFVVAGLTLLAIGGGLLRERRTTKGGPRGTRSGG
ncbi:MAG: hypothetical protein ACJ72D_04865 [Marmoricola sp.]